MHPLHHPQDVCRSCLLKPQSGVSKHDLEAPRRSWREAEQSQTWGRNPTATIVVLMTQARLTSCSARPILLSNASQQPAVWCSSTAGSGRACHHLLPANRPRLCACSTRLLRCVLVQGAGCLCDHDVQLTVFSLPDCTRPMTSQSTFGLP